VNVEVPMVKPFLKNLIRLVYPLHVPIIINRNELPFILNGRGLLGEGVEVGVQHGRFSEFILQHWRGRVLYSVDAWKAFPRTEYRDVLNVSQEEQDRVYDEARQRLVRFGPRSRMMRQLSTEAAKEFRDGQLDFVYLDAMHSYQGVADDLCVWHTKVRQGGILGGHDYMNGEIGGTLFGVKQAVDEFAAGHGCRVKVTRAEPDFKSWFIFL
jgi:hypothetical protein